MGRMTEVECAREPGPWPPDQREVLHRPGVDYQRYPWPVPRAQTNRYGIVATGKDDGSLAEVAGMVEKPKPESAPSTLAIIGRYVLLPEVFKHLDKQERGAGNEIQLTDAMAKMVGNTPFHALRFTGERHDCGNRLGFLEANLALGLKNPDIASELRSIARRLLGS